MERIGAAAAKANFEVLLDKAQDDPIMISKRGRDVAVLMSAEDYHEHQQWKLDVLKQEIQKGLDEVKRSRLISSARAFAAFDEELRKK